MKSFEVSNKTLLGILFILLFMLKLLSGKAQSGSHYPLSVSFNSATTHLSPGWNTGRSIASVNATQELSRVFSIEASYYFICVGSRLVLLQGFPSRSSRLKTRQVYFRRDMLF